MTLANEPTPHDFIQELAKALHGKEMPARALTPKQVWEELLVEVRALAGTG